jgi:hypothetical protein
LDSNRNIFAGPWVGELGWELFAWQGYLRMLSEVNEYDKFIVCGRKGHDFFYEDFATGYTGYRSSSEETSMWLCNGRLADFDYRDYANYHIIKPANYSGEAQRFVKWGLIGEHQYDIVIHARSTNKCDTNYRNWDREHWVEFVKAFTPIRAASIGTTEAALHIEGTDDKRDIPLRDLSDLMANSLVLVGPSSGPMHFGSLCGIPHVSWSTPHPLGLVSNKKRYEKTWNPFGTPVTFIEGSWHPDVTDVVRATKEKLESR